MKKLDLEEDDDEGENDEYEQEENQGPRALYGFFQHWLPHELRVLFLSRFEIYMVSLREMPRLGDALLVACRV